MLLKELIAIKVEADVLDSVHAVFVVSESMYSFPPTYISIFRQMLKLATIM